MSYHFNPLGDELELTEEEAKNRPKSGKADAVDVIALAGGTDARHWKEGGEATKKDYKAFTKKEYEAEIAKIGRNKIKGAADALPHVADDFHEGFTYEEEELLSEEEELEAEDERLRQQFEHEQQTPIAADPAPHVDQALRTPQSASEFLDVDVSSLDDDMEQSPSIQVTSSGRWDASDEVLAAEKIADNMLDESVAALEFGKDEDHISEELRDEVLVSTADKIRDEVERVKGDSPVEAGMLATVGTMLISMVASAAFEPAVEQLTTEFEGSFAGIAPGPTPFEPAVTEEDIESSAFLDPEEPVELDVLVRDRDVLVRDRQQALQADLSGAAPRRGSDVDASVSRSHVSTAAGSHAETADEAAEHASEHGFFDPSIASYGTDVGDVYAGVAGPRILHSVRQRARAQQAQNLAEEKMDAKPPPKTRIGKLGRNPPVAIQDRPVVSKKIADVLSDLDDNPEVAQLVEKGKLKLEDVDDPEMVRQMEASLKKRKAVKQMEGRDPHEDHTERHFTHR